MDKIITKGIVINNEDNRTYTLNGVHATGPIITGGRGYCLRIREEKDTPKEYAIMQVTEVSRKGSVANMLQLEHVVTLTEGNFVYKGSEGEI